MPKTTHIRAQSRDHARDYLKNEGEDSSDCSEVDAGGLSIHTHTRPPEGTDPSGDRAHSVTRNGNNGGDEVPKVSTETAVEGLLRQNPSPDKHDGDGVGLGDSGASAGSQPPSLRLGTVPSNNPLFEPRDPGHGPPSELLASPPPAAPPASSMGNDSLEQEGSGLPDAFSGAGSDLGPDMESFPSIEKSAEVPRVSRGSAVARRPTVIPKSLSTLRNQAALHPPGVERTTDEHLLVFQNSLMLEAPLDVPHQGDASGDESEPQAPFPHDDDQEDEGRRGVSFRVMDRFTGRSQSQRESAAATQADTQKATRNGQSEYEDDEISLPDRKSRCESS